MGGLIFLTEKTEIIQNKKTMLAYFLLNKQPEPLIQDC